MHRNNHYQALRDKLHNRRPAPIPLAGKVKIGEEHAGLHFLMELDTQRSDQDPPQAARLRTFGSLYAQYYGAGRAFMCW